MGRAARRTSDTIRVKGSVSGRRLNRFGVGVASPALLAAGALRQALQEAGIEVAGPARVGSTPGGGGAGAPPPVRCPLAAMIPKLNQESDNFFAEHLWKAAAPGRSSARGATRAAARPRRCTSCARAGVPAGQLYQADGSGLSEYNRVSPNAMVRALVYAHGPPVLGALPQLAGRGRGRRGHHAAPLPQHGRGGQPPRQDRLHRRRAHALRLTSEPTNGELIAFSFLYNGRGTSAARGVQEELGVLLADYGGPAPAVQHRAAR